MQILIEQVNKFIAAGWKSLNTCASLYDALAKAEGRLNPTSPESSMLRSLRKQVAQFRKEIADATIDVNPHVVVRGTPVLPRVAWLPMPVLDEESGMLTYASQPPIPEGLSKAELCHWKQAQADALLLDADEPAKEKPVVPTRRQRKTKNHGVENS